MMLLPDAILCHKFLAILGMEKIGEYLFDNDFDVIGIKVCTDCIPNRDTCNDCCIGNNQQVLDALSSNKNFKDHIKDTLDIVDAFFKVNPMAKKGHPSPREIFLLLDQMMRVKLYTSLSESYWNQLLASWKASLQPLTPENEYFPSAPIIKTPFPSQWAINHQPIKKKVNSGIDHDYLLLWCVNYVTKVDWSITEGFENVLLLPSSPYFQALENIIRNKKALGLLLYFSGLLPYIMNSQTQQDCPLQKNTEITLQHPEHMHSHVQINAKTNTVRREGRINALQFYTLQNLAFRLIHVTQTLWSGSKISQKYIYWMKIRNFTNFSLFFTEEMHRFFDPLPTTNNERVHVSKETKNKLRKAFGSYTSTFMHQINLISTLPYVAKDFFEKEKIYTSWMLYPSCLLCLGFLLHMD